MGERGRASAAELAVVPVAVDPNRPPPPAELDARGQARWRAIVDDYPAGHFRPGDLGLLASFVRTEGLLEAAHKLVADEGQLIEGPRGPRINPAMRLAAQHTKLLASLAVKLRLCPSTRMKENNKSVNRSAGPKLWETT